MKRILTTILLLAASGWHLAFSQDGANAKSKVLELTNATYLRQLSDKLREEAERQKAEARAVALQKNWLINEKPAHGMVLELQRLSPSGQPVYYKTFNLEAAITTGTNRLAPRSELGLNLTGDDFEVGIWDAGSVNEEHRELRGRVFIVDDTPFGTHDTHVAGTIAATGINPEARGMAPDALLRSYDFNNDNAEMAEEAAKGMLISNHSYGLLAGWQVVGDGSGWRWFGDESISTIEDYKFGYYSEDDSRVWDDITYNAPYYLIVKAAGNDRTDVGDGSGAPPDGPYDILEPKSVAKNILTVGAVDRIPDGYRSPADVQMSSFSSWGPTDDGRIKPDLVGAGVNILSSVSDAFDAYEQQSGTSMAAPNVTGSLVLLQELYARVKAGNYMKSATLKGLAIHTTRQATADPGPTYEFGWGLLAADRAANLITREDGEAFQIREASIPDGGIRVFTVTSDGTSPLVATISWTDVPGNPVAPTLDSDSLMLINDLDMRIFSEDSTYLPWILDPSNPSRRASRGDNFRDNVEKIEIPNPAPGEYTILINHKGSLVNERQDFSLIVSARDLNSDLNTYYWIGSSGDWNDPNNWSLRSGGQPAGSVPGIENPVIFDDASFTDASPLITLSEDAEAYNINWYTATAARFDLQGNTLNINGSIDISQPGVIFDNGLLNLSGQTSKGNYIRIPENALANAEIELNGINASWNLLSDLSARNITIQSGSLNVVDRQLNAAQINVPTGFAQALNLSGSTVEGLRELSLNPNASVDFSNTTFRFTNPGSDTLAYVLNGAGKALGNVIVGQGTELTIRGDNIISQLEINGQAILNGSNTIDALQLSSGGDLILQGGTTQNIVSQLGATGLAEQRITFRSTGGVASLVSENETARFCFDFIEVENVNVSGLTPFVAGENSTLGQNTQGWIPGSCENLLFANFSADFLCPQGVTQFTDQSTGDASSWTWTIDDPQFNSSDINARNPTYTFRFPGTYTVTLTISNGETTSSRTREVVVPPNTSGLSVPEVIFSGDSLFSSVTAPAYQWYKDGEPIVGAISRSIQLGDAELGSYTVEVSNGDCRFIADPLLVNSVSDEVKETSFSVYPNPVKDRLTILFSEIAAGQEITNLDLYTANGYKLLHHQLKSSMPGNQLEIRTESLQAGVYILQIRQGDKVESFRLLKE
ncbi:MAG: S8 family serine peptidase [Cyclobacteriaceae bacterium]